MAGTKAVRPSVAQRKRLFMGKPFASET
jgi:hypothetical protein